ARAAPEPPPPSGPDVPRRPSPDTPAGPVSTAATAGPPGRAPPAPGRSPTRAHRSAPPCPGRRGPIRWGRARPVRPRPTPGGASRNDLRPGRGGDPGDPGLPLLLGARRGDQHREPDRGQARRPHQRHVVVDAADPARLVPDDQPVRQPGGDAVAVLLRPERALALRRRHRTGEAP